MSLDDLKQYSNPLMNQLVKSILKKHGVDLSQVEGPSEEERQEILKMVSDLQGNVQQFLDSANDKKEENE